MGWAGALRRSCPTGDKYPKKQKQDQKNCAEISVIIPRDSHVHFISWWAIVMGGAGWVLLTDMDCQLGGTKRLHIFPRSLPRFSRLQSSQLLTALKTLTKFIINVSVLNLHHLEHCTYIYVQGFLWLSVLSGWRESPQTSMCCLECLRDCRVL